MAFGNLPAFPKVLFLVGAPGAGKTTLVRNLLESVDPLGLRYLVPKPKWTIVPDKLALAGHYTGSTFDGADTVPYNGVEEAIAFWKKDLRSIPLTILDGDRFSHKKALDAFLDARAMVYIALLEGTPGLLAERRAARGSTQNPAWMKGRETKAAKFAALDPHAVRLDASKSPTEIANALTAAFGP